MMDRLILWFGGDPSSGFDRLITGLMVFALVILVLLMASLISTLRGGRPFDHD